MSPEPEPEPESFGQRRVVRTLRAKVTFARSDKMLKKLVSNKDAQSFSNYASMVRNLEKRLTC
jgi:hypothetical protein